MSYDEKTFYRAACDYPECLECYSGDEYEWWFSKSWALEDVEDNSSWLVIDGDDGVARFFCPRHLRLDDGDWVVCCDLDDEEYMPANGELIPYYAASVSLKPLPKPECEATILQILKGNK